MAAIINSPGWRTSFSSRGTWRRGLTLGIPVGFLQVAVNQGDVWLRGAADAVVVLKSIASPMIAIGIAVCSAAWAEAMRPAELERELARDETDELIHSNN